MKEPQAARGVEPPEPFRAFAAKYPKVVGAYERFGEAVRDAGPLTPREVALAKFAISVGARMQGSAHAHARKALAQAIDGAALEHVALLSAPTIGFPNMMAALGWVRDVLDDATEPS
jgi:alkylhydroperoxidase/carboxymuconolactone decarboxylase family protein YurZ